MTWLRLSLAAAALLTACGPRPPKGMRRLDSGRSNWGYQVGQRLQRLYYADGEQHLRTHLNLVDLDTFSRRSLSFPSRRITGFIASPLENSVMVGAMDTSPARKPEEAVMEVDPETGKVLAEEFRSQVSAHDLMGVERVFGKGDPFSTAPPPASGSSSSVRASEAILAEPVKEGRLGLKVVWDAADRRTVRFYPTLGYPEFVTVTDAGTIYAAYVDTSAVSVIEEFDYGKGTRRPVARLPGRRIESMAVSGAGLLALHTDLRQPGPRTLSVVDGPTGRVALDLPWSDGESFILAVDPKRNRLYLRMSEGKTATAWAVPLAPDSLVAASKYLSRARGPEARRYHIGAYKDLIVMVLLIAGAAFVIAMAASG